MHTDVYTPRLIASGRTKIPLDYILSLQARQPSTTMHICTRACNQGGQTVCVDGSDFLSPLQSKNCFKDICKEAVVSQSGPVEATT